jgi:serine/threonine protein kinase
MAVEKQANPATAPGAEEDALVGRTIGGRYRIVGTVGFGGMGRVYDAVQAPLDRHVAIKVLLGGHAHDAAFRRRFMLEAAVTSKLTHPNTVTLFDYGETDGIYFIAMELLKGRTLSDVVRQEGALSQERAIHIAQQVCRSLSEAHSQGVIHRDLKPANVMLLSQRHELDFAKVLDFGLVKFFTDSGDGGQTHQGTFVGTPHYVSPEQARDEQPDPRSDVYSLGILLYLMLTGQVPFHASSAVEVLVKQLNDKPVTPRERRPDLNIDPNLEALVLKCLAKQRDERVQSMDELLASLTQVRSHISDQSRGMARGPDPLSGVSPPGLQNPTPPVRSRPVAASPGTPGSVALGSISSRVPNSTPRPISTRVPHSIPPTPALVQTPSPSAKKRGPVIAMGAALGLAIAIVGAAWFVKSHRPAAKVAPRPTAAAPVEAAVHAMTMQIELDGRRPAEPASSTTAPAASANAPAPTPAQAAPSQQVAAETKAPAKEPARTAPQKEQPKAAHASKPAATPARKPEPVRAAAKETEKTVAKAPAPPPPAPEAPAAKPVEPAPAPSVAAASISGSNPPPTLPISTRPREVSSALLQTQKINNPPPRIPEWFQRNFARQTMQAVYRICIGTDGRVSEIKVVTALGGGVDDELLKQIKATWTYRPQLIPLCADSKMMFRL